MNELHEEIFEFLFEKYLDARAKGEEFYFRMAADNRRNPNYIFWGNSEWLQLSFWSGFSANQNYVIMLLINTKSKNLSLQIREHFAENIDELAIDIAMEKMGDYGFYQKGYGNYEDVKDLKRILNEFIEGDKIKIDEFLLKLNNERIRKIHKQEFDSEYFKLLFLKSSSIPTPPFLSPILPNKLFQLQRIWIHNFHGIKEIHLEEIPENTRWIFVTGENGIGKTVFLQAIALGLQTATWLESNAEKYKYIIGVKYLNAESQSINAFNRPSALYGYESPPNDIPVVAYSCNRLSETEIKPEIPSIGHLFDKTGMINVDAWLKSLLKDTEYNSETSKNPPQLAKDQQTFDVLFYAFKKILHIQSIKLDDTKENVLYIEQNEQGEVVSAVSFEKLSAGYRTLLCLIGDIIARLSHSQVPKESPTFSDGSLGLAADTTEIMPNAPQYYQIKTPEDLSGIVIIDEFENHLHAKFQRKAVEILTKLFENVQFIVSTHSPIPLLGAPQESVILHVERDLENGITVKRWDDLIAFKDLLPNALLSSPIFGLYDLIPSDRDTDRLLANANDYQEVFFEEMLNKKLRKLREEPDFDFEKFKNE